MKERNYPAKQLRPAAAAVIVFVILAGAFLFFEMQMYSQRRENHRYMAANQTQLISGCLNTVMTRVYTLRALVQAGGGTLDSFDETAEKLYNETAEDTGLYVKNFILAPGGVVEKIYPLEGNEGLLGFDYMDATLAGNATAIEAYQENKLVLTAPFSLAQGGVGLAGRLPVYLTGEDGEETFWGMVSVTLDLDSLLEKFNLDYLEQSGIDYCLWYTDSAGEKVVLASSDDLPTDPVGYEMSAVNLDWTLDVAPEDGWLPPLEIGGALAVILAISLLLFRAFQSGARIRAMNVLLKELAIKDNLTGCYSRHYLNVMLLTHKTREWKDPNANYSLAIVDVDCFKQVNDVYGHDVGDLALVAIADILRGQCDDLRGDCVVRYGGDEFVFLMNNVYRERFEDRLRNIVEQVRKVRISQAPEVRLSVSVGGVMGDRTKNYYEMFSMADEQVYLAKEGGKDRYVLA